MLTDTMAGLLVAMAARPMPPLEELSAEGYRAMLAAMPKMPDPSVERVTARDIVGAPCPVRLYRPVATEGAVPALIFYHGGGYIACSIDSHDNLCRKLAALAGVAVLSVDYRLAPEHMFPAAVDDAYDVAKWIVDRADDLELDSARIGIGGDSAGGSLSIVTALRFRDEGGPVSLAHMLLLYPSTDLMADTQSRRDFADGFGLDEAVSQWFLAQYIPVSVDRTDWRLSPARSASLAGLPSATIVTAGCDPLRDEAEDFACMLNESGVAAEVQRFDGVIHGFMSMYQIVPEGEQAIRYAATRLHEILAA